MTTVTAAALVIGNEILSGKVVDENLPFLAEKLWEWGVSLQEVRTIRDQVDVIAGAVKTLSDCHNYLFTTGGIGPTHDDVTVEAVAQAFQVPLVVDPLLEELIRVSDPDGSPTDSQLRMAMVPEGSELVGNVDASWPTVRMVNVYMFPGIPSYFRKRLIALEDQLRFTPFVRCVLYTTMSEGALAEPLHRVVRRFPGVEVGSYPTVERSDYRVMVTFEGRDGAGVEAARRALQEALPGSVVIPAKGG